MMSKNLIGFLVGILLLLTNPAFSQPEDKIVPVPEWVAGLIIDELIVKDGLVYELSKKDSILTVYEAQLENNKMAIAAYKLNQKEYKTVINNKDLIIESKIKETKELSRSNRGLKFLIVIESIVVLLLLTLG